MKGIDVYWGNCIAGEWKCPYNACFHEGDEKDRNGGPPPERGKYYFLRRGNFWVSEPQNPRPDILAHLPAPIKICDAIGNNNDEPARAMLQEPPPPNSFFILYNHEDIEYRIYQIVQ